MEFLIELSAAHGMICSGKVAVHLGHHAVRSAVGHTSFVPWWSISNDIYQRVNEASCCRRVNISCCLTRCRYHRRWYPGCYVAPWFQSDVLWNLSQSFLPRGGDRNKNRFKDRRTLCLFQQVGRFSWHSEGYLDCVCLNSCVYGGSEMAAVCRLYC
jgi:hypothetical protein